MAVRTSDASQTLSLLEERLHRLDFILNGTTPSDLERSAAHSQTHTTQSASIRLRNLEASLQDLSSHSRTIADLLALQQAHPGLFNSQSSSEAPTTLSQPALASLILAHSGLYRNTATQLSQLQDLSIPDASSATKLIEQQERIDKARVKQDQQAKEFADLRSRSARILEEWYQEGVLDMGEQWAQWEERLKEVEILIRRKEAVKKREEGLI